MVLSPAARLRAPAFRSGDWIQVPSKNQGDAGLGVRAIKGFRQGRSWVVSPKTEEVGWVALHHRLDGDRPRVVGVSSSRGILLPGWMGCTACRVLRDRDLDSLGVRAWADERRLRLSWRSGVWRAKNAHKARPLSMSYHPRWILAAAALLAFGASAAACSSSTEGSPVERTATRNEALVGTSPTPTRPPPTSAPAPGCNYYWDGLVWSEMCISPGGCTNGSCLVLAGDADAGCEAGLVTAPIGN